MAFTSPALTFTLLIATICCLMVTTAEEDVAVTPEIRESKQLFSTPQFYPGNSQYYYPENPYGIPFGVPAEGVPNYQGAARIMSYPSGPLDDTHSGGIPSWRYVHTGGHDKIRWWKKNFHREATVIITPAAAECSVAAAPAAGVANIVTDGLGPCKYATQAEQGTISITFSAADQAAFIAITADSQRNTRVKLTCNNIVGAKVFTQSGQIIDFKADTPRTEIGFMQIIAVGSAAGDLVKCNWHSYHHYTGTYP
ncbi:hypothetical protein DAPPUDRAFT_94071 [Daphnia pulex]|uniref:Uncharacterized protein n=1 Tax=Daphnia pulex TaxID=6669 RepID=E9FS19_DAPPU|nr:hypothetical protein DAPPUDRAFT_94071 [Daphnia pulex]|eukprot:EFX89954.1 hypothetical protein DAPPUDRAFT_94071 [Daphnia pulex]